MTIKSILLRAAEVVETKGYAADIRHAESLDVLNRDAQFIGSVCAIGAVEVAAKCPIGAEECAEAMKALELFARHIDVAEGDLSFALDYVADWSNDLRSHGMESAQKMLAAKFREVAEGL